MPTAIRPEASENTLPRGPPEAEEEEGSPLNRHPREGTCTQKPAPLDTIHFRDGDTEAQSRRALGPSHTGREQQNAAWNPMPGPQFWNQTHRLLEDSEVRKENRASGDVRLGATRSEGQEKLGLPELGRAGWTSQLHFHPSRPATPPEHQPSKGSFSLAGPPAPPQGSLSLLFSSLLLSSPIPPSESGLRFWPGLVHIIMMTVIIIVVVIKYLSARGEKRTPALPHSHC